jgi:hypothetical protein
VNLYGKTFRAGFFGGCFNRCSHGYTGFSGVCWRCGLWHPARFFRDLWWELSNGN